MTDEEKYITKIQDLELLVQKKSDRIEQLEQELRGNYWDRIPVEWKLTNQQSRIFCTLLKNAVASNDRILTSLYRDVDKECSLSSLKVQVHHLRKKLLPYGVVIKNKFATGYYMEEQSRNILRERWGLE